MQDYSNKTQEYFAAARTDVATLLPARVESVLEVGCGTGATLRWLKEHSPVGHTTGIELFESAAQSARPYVDRLIVGDAERLVAAGVLASEEFDLILCLDVLEHMIDPWEFVSRITRTLKPGGTLIASIPNVRHLSVIADLVARGRWDYRSAGILDRTHLRFFTLSTAKDLLSSKELEVVELLYNVSPVRSRSGLLNFVTFGLLKGLLATQFVLASRKKVPN